MAVNAEARTPNYSGTSSADWSKPSFQECVTGYYKNHPDADRPEDEVNDVDEAPAAMKTWIASLSLLGNADADMFDELLFFPVVDPSSMALNENALEAVISGRGSQADIPDSAKESAQRKAYQLLNDVFERELEIPDDLKQAKSIGEELAETIREKAERVRNI